MILSAEDQGSTSVHKITKKKKILIPGLSRFFFDLNPKLNREFKTEMVELPFTRLTENILESSRSGAGWGREARGP